MAAAHLWPDFDSLGNLPLGTVEIREVYTA